MVTRPEPRTTTLALALLAGSLLACKMFKKGEEEQLPPVPSATVAPTVSPPVAPPPTAATPAPTLKLGDVKRFADKEKKAEGVVKVLEADVKVFNEPDVKAQHVAELNKNIFVSRLATLDDFVLVEFPSGVGELSPGWVQAKFLSDPDAKVSDDKVKQQAAVKVVGDDKAKADPKATTGTTSTAATGTSTTGTATSTTGTATTTGAADTTTGTSTTGEAPRVKRKRP